MYLARISDKKHGRRYVIRQSYADGRCYRSRDLFDLGRDPSDYIVYPGGNGFYIEPSVEDAIVEKGIHVSQSDLEPLFIPFLAAHIRRVIDGFDRRDRSRPSSDECIPASAVHRFDRYRLHYLKFGQVNHRDLGCTPNRFYKRLHFKSRDEIEYDFITAERILKPDEIAHYAYQIFDLQRYFSESFAHLHPESLDQQRMDRFFIDTLCQLNQDDAFWEGCEDTFGLRPHLVRYAIMYFDHCFPRRDPFHDILRDFMNRHRIHRPSERVQVSLAESARVFGVSVDELKKMDCRALTRRYRKMAQRHHPDKGGDQETFVKLSAAYDNLLKRKSRN